MRVVPLYVLFDGVPLRDHVDIAPAAFYERLEASTTLPTTSQPTPEDFLACYRELREAGYMRILSLHISPKLSGTLESARRAAVERRLARGTTDGEVDELVARFRETNRVVFTTATLEYLQKGGRIGKAQALAGSLLNVKPILEIRNGVVEPVGRVRGRQKALEEFARLFAEDTEDAPGLHTAIAHANAPEWIDVLTDLVAKTRPEATVDLVQLLGAVVGTHAGPGAVGFFWFQD